MNPLLYYPVFAFWYIASLLPLRLLYLFSDFLYYLLYFVVRYRRRVVRWNLASSFPEKSVEEIIQIEKNFYSFFCDYIAETIKLFSMSEKEMKRRMQFEGIDMVKEAFHAGRSCSLYLGHYGNWEWISSVPLYFNEPDELCGQIYHPLENQSFDRLFLHMRERFGAKSVQMDDTFRTIMKWKKKGLKSFVGYISDQVPGYNNIHYWTDFLNHDTPVFTGAERISRIADNVVFYGDVYRVKRGYYVCKIVKIADELKELPHFYVTEQYFRLLEKTIQRAPEYWLWSHKRWKRTREVYDQLYSKEEQQKRLSRL